MSQDIYKVPISTCLFSAVCTHSGFHVSTLMMLMIPQVCQKATLDGTVLVC